MQRDIKETIRPSDVQTHISDNWRVGLRTPRSCAQTMQRNIKDVVREIHIQIHICENCSIGLNAPQGDAHEQCIAISKKHFVRATFKRISLTIAAFDLAPPKATCANDASRYQRNTPRANHVQTHIFDNCRIRFSNPR